MIAGDMQYCFLYTCSKYLQQANYFGKGIVLLDEWYDLFVTENEE